MYFYRAMKSIGQGLPACGEGARLLGVRPGIDIGVDDQGRVQPESGGMSVFSDPASLPKHRKPAWMSGGEGRDPLYSIEEASLPGELAAIRDGCSCHFFWAPAMACPYRLYLSVLYGTQRSWREEPCPMR